ncbi:MAG: nucleoside recognition protein [Lachnospirales bacterium]
MLNYIWGLMLIISLVYSFIFGSTSEIVNEILNSGKDTVNLVINIVGIMGIWSGIIKIAEKSGMVDVLCIALSPLLQFLFPKIPKNSKAMKYISVNFVANLLGLSYVATPAGINAMIELNKLNKTPGRATKEMCNFLIINMSSLQIISINIIAYRSQYNSVNPQEIIGAGLIATFITTVFAIMFTKAADYFVKE